jgi:UDP-GlcNAc:undecaprenyl-phosphate GlcNAc-1-phosphate transferase
MQCSKLLYTFPTRVTLAFIGTSLLPFLVAFGVTLLATPVVRALALRAGAVALPKQDRWHRRPVALLGGVAVVFGVAVAIAATVGIHGRAAWGLVAASGCLFGVGLVDDFLHLKPSTKLTAQIVVACLPVALGVTLQWTASSVANAIGTIFWIVAVANAVNLLDNMDGLCAGVSGIAALSFAVGGISVDLTGYALAVAGACAAFLIFNFKPASIFLGDSGSLFLGTTLAVLGVASGHGDRVKVTTSLAVPALILLIPLFDTAFVTLSRKLSARPASMGGRDHTSHRMVAFGFSERQAVLLFYVLAATGGATAAGLVRYEWREAPVLLGVLLLGLVLLALQLARVKVYAGADFTALKDRRYTPLLLDITYKRRIFEVLLDLCLVSFAYYASYVVRFDREFSFYYDLLSQSLAIVIACQMGSFFVMGVYRGVWRYFSTSDVGTYVKGVVAGTTLSILVLVYLYRFEGYSRGVFMIDALILGALIIGSRASFRLLTDIASRHGIGENRAIIYGAGDGGAMLVRELRNNPIYPYRPIGFLDDSPAKANRKILGIPVFGGVERGAELIRAHQPKAVILSTDKVSPERVQAIQAACRAAGVPLLRFAFTLREVGDEAVVPPYMAGHR